MKNHNKPNNKRRMTIILFVAILVVLIVANIAVAIFVQDGLAHNILQVTSSIIVAASSIVFSGVAIWQRELYANINRLNSCIREISDRQIGMENLYQQYSLENSMFLFAHELVADDKAILPLAQTHYIAKSLQRQHSVMYFFIRKVAMQGHFVHSKAILVGTLVQAKALLCSQRAIDSEFVESCISIDHEINDAFATYLKDLEQKNQDLASKGVEALLSQLRYEQHQDRERYSKLIANRDCSVEDIVAIGQ